MHFYAIYRGYPADVPYMSPAGAATFAWVTVSHHARRNTNLPLTNPIYTMKTFALIAILGALPLMAQEAQTQADTSQQNNCPACAATGSTVDCPQAGVAAAIGFQQGFHMGFESGFTQAVRILNSQPTGDKCPKGCKGCNGAPHHHGPRPASAPLPASAADSAVEAQGE